jgi:ribulose-phosphate 3-epimerase
MSEIIPAILAQSKQEFEQKLRQVESFCPLIQVDVLDGSLYEHTSWFDAKHVGALETPVSFELHLMVENPLPIIGEWKKFVPGLKRVIVHHELDRPVGTILSHAKDYLHLETAIAFNPETPIEEAQTLLPHVDQVTIMGVHPGFSGRTFEGEYILEKIRQLKRLYPKVVVEIDGGITEALIPSLLQAGANRFAVASLVFSSENPSQEIVRIQTLLLRPQPTSSA